MLEVREIATGLQFPEGPIAMADGSIILVEIARGTLSRVTPSGSVEVIADLGGGPNGAAMGPDGAIYVCNNGGFEWHSVNGLLLPGDRPADYETGRIERVDLATGRVDRLYETCDGNRLNGPNDIVFDTGGGFWFTDLGKTYGRVRDRGAVYYAKPDGSLIREAVFPLDTPNGIGLSADEKTLYVAETITGSIRSADIAAPGELAGAGRMRGHALCRPGDAHNFDSLALDSEGHICVATLGNGGITRARPDGSGFEHFATDDPITTNICFGGPALRTAYITLSGTGRLVAADWPCPGLALNFLNR